MVQSDPQSAPLEENIESAEQAPDHELITTADGPDEDAGSPSPSGAADAPASAEAAADNEENAPSKIVIDIVDRICDELADIGDRVSEELFLAIERIAGGAAALMREARNAGHMTSAQLCDDMMNACRALQDIEEVPGDRFLDLAFAFCGVYVEAMSDEGSPNVSEWRSECERFVSGPAAQGNKSGDAPKDQAPETAASESSAEAASDELEDPFDGSVSPDGPIEKASDSDSALGEPGVNAAVETTGEKVDELGELDELGGDISGAVEAPEAPEGPAQESAESTQEMTELGGEIGESLDPAPDADAADSTVSEKPAAGTASAPETPDRDGAVSDESAPPIEDTSRSQSLFVLAQEALAKGDGATAKELALQAAALIAKVEVQTAGQQLQEAESRLKASWRSTDEYREQVKSAESRVMNAAGDVADAERALGEAREQTALMAQGVDEADASVLELDRLIAKFQAKREAQLEKVEAAKERQEETKRQEVKADESLAEFRKGEDETRQELEAARQEVKDLQRVVQEIESDMEKARESLTEKKMSLADIEQTLTGPEHRTEEDAAAAGEMLF